MFVPPHRAHGPKAGDDAVHRGIAAPSINKVRNFADHFPPFPNFQQPTNSLKTSNKLPPTIHNAGSPAPSPALPPNRSRLGATVWRRTLVLGSSAGIRRLGLVLGFSAKSHAGESPEDVHDKPKDCSHDSVRFPLGNFCRSSRVGYRACGG